MLGLSDKDDKGLLESFLTNQKNKEMLILEGVFYNWPLHSFLHCCWHFHSFWVD